MMEENRNRIQSDTLTSLCDEFQKNNRIEPEKFERYGVKRGLRNADGSGVMAGLTLICNVHGYVINEAERSPVEGRLIYRGIDIHDLVNGCAEEDRFGFEETAWLLLFGKLPTRPQLERFSNLLSECRELPDYFAEDMIIKAPSPNIMNKLARSVLALYSYDDNPEDLSMENVLRQSIELIAMLPTIMGYAYQVKRRHYDKESMVIHPTLPGLSTAETILRSIRADTVYTKEEARLLDLCLMLHAEHGGGNNSTFAARVLSSSGTDTYSAIAAALGSLKGPRHGGANIKVVRMFEDMKNSINTKDEDAVAGYLTALLNREAFDKAGLIYGIGHAVYSESDPRAGLLMDCAASLAAEKGYEDDYVLYSLVARLAPEIIAKKRKMYKGVSANVDFYSGLIYRMLDLPCELYTPIFAMARIAGWSAHRLEELQNAGKIIRPAYIGVKSTQEYVPIENR